MHLIRSSLALFGLILLLTPAQAAPPDPLHWAPEQSDLVIKIDQPRQLVDSVVNLDLFKQLQSFGPFAEFYDTGPFRRFFEILYYFERELGANRHDLIEQLAGNGIVFAVQFAPPSPVILAVQGKDEALMKKFQATALRVLESELARLDIKDAVKTGKHRDFEGIRIGNDFYVTRVGATLLISNKGEGLKTVIDQHLDKKKTAADNPKLIAARRLLPPDPMAWGYVNLDLLREAPQLKALFAMPNENPALPAFLGGYLDVLRRAPYTTAGLYRRPGGFLATVRVPAGREGSAAEVAAHIPPADQPGSRPLLQPKNVLFSTSYYFDLEKVFQHRDKLLGEQAAEFLNGIDMGTRSLPGGLTLSKILGMIGPYQRFVAAAPEKTEYKIQPGVQLPAFAFVLEMREPKTLQSLLYPAVIAGALQIPSQFKVKSTEEKIAGHSLTGYRFGEDGKFPQDANNIRFNFSPCFAFVNNQFLVCSSMELGRELVTILDKESKGETETIGRPHNAAAGRTLFSGTGGAFVLKNLEEQLFVQNLLGSGLTPENAKKQVQTLLDLVKRAGTLQLEATYGAKEFRYDFELKLGR